MEKLEALKCCQLYLPAKYKLQVRIHATNTANNVTNTYPFDFDFFLYRKDLSIKLKVVVSNLELYQSRWETKSNFQISARGCSDDLIKVDLWGEFDFNCSYIE